jgi:hypothetical protein
MIHHLGAKLLGAAALTGGALVIKHFWHGPGKVVPVTPHGQTVTPGGQVVSPPPALPGGSNPKDTTIDTSDTSNASVDENYSPALSTGGMDVNTSSSDFAGDVLTSAADGAAGDALDALAGL